MLPDEVRIGCYDYEVVETDEILLLDNKRCKGHIDHNAHQIKIASNDMFSRQSKEQTLWHEIIHGIIDYRNVNYGNANEETFVDELATGLYLLCKSNGRLPGQERGE